MNARYPARPLDRKGELRALSPSARRYTAPMEAFDPDFTIRRRKPRGRPIRTQGGEGGMVGAGNNYLAETPKNPVGARPGNRNALKHGRHTAASIALRRRVSDLKARIAAAIASVGKTP